MSHTNFNTGAFGAGSLTASLGIAGALVGGMQNAAADMRRREQEQWDAWDRAQLVAALNLSEALRAGERRTARRRECVMLALQLENRRLLGRPVISEARASL